MGDGILFIVEGLLSVVLVLSSGVLLLGLVHAMSGDPLSASISFHLFIAGNHLDDFIHRVAFSGLRLFHNIVDSIIV